ncbi:hypothetical protein NECAME_16334 [Necator americanus]|uniref:Biopolymer transporter ExbD n=1 Tax=Necator americanus TaxID=51031 RepID=W2TZH7_NECAM|nr:hypothetical protein NECAME_16334 [Necator americanus]ETN86432.1 hypothetical protein NECAME_16334 [Necator americanus]
MAMSVGDEGGDDEVISAINTTPLVDVMLVLLIIFLITIPVVTQYGAAPATEANGDAAADAAEEHRDRSEPRWRLLLVRATRRCSDAARAPEGCVRPDAAAGSAYPRRPGDAL